MKGLALKGQRGEDGGHELQNCLRSFPKVMALLQLDSFEITTVTLYWSLRRKLDLETANVRSKNAEKMRSVGKQSCKPLTLKTPLLFARDQIGCRAAFLLQSANFDMLSILTHVNEGLHACKGEGTCQDSNIKKSQGTSRITSLEGIF